jgi:ABC-type branched-subunit amino acid transport system ATPase component
MSANADPILEIVDLRAGYEDVLILDGITMSVPVGNVVSIVGPNGAGKSTLVKAVYGLAAVRAGTVMLRVDGRRHDITRKKPHELTALGMNYVPQIDNVFPSLSVLENLSIGSVSSASTKEEALGDVWSTFPFLRELRDRPAGVLSGGQRQTLAIARALMSRPRLLLLDEPSAGLAPRLVDEVFGTVQRIHEMGVTIIMVEQNARRALAISDYGWVLESGRNRYEGTGRALLEDDRVVELYLGKRGLPLLPGNGGPHQKVGTTEDRSEAQSSRRSEA